ncbi:hypothetical protein U1Q18_038020 [Sarracenia purpurea var. burkii]
MKDDRESQSQTNGRCKSWEWGNGSIRLVEHKGSMKGNGAKTGTKIWLLTSLVADLSCHCKMCQDLDLVADVSAVVDRLQRGDIGCLQSRKVGRGRFVGFCRISGKVFWWSPNLEEGLSVTVAE